MTKTKSTKRALLMSGLALLLCLSMFVGSTFAWFTDSVSTGVNKIKSGNLDVELYHMNFAEAAKESNWSVGFGIPQNETGEKVGPDTKLFLNEEGKPMLWEPGATCVESFRIKNEGSLALKYQFKIEFANATETPEGKTLADIINISAEEINYAENGVPTGKSGGIANLDDRKLGDGYVFEGTLLAGEEYNFWVGLQWVPSDVDNEFNVKEGLSIDMGVTLLATQFTYEKDNYYDGDQYDAGAEYPTVALPPITSIDDLREAIATGGNFVLGADVAIPETLTVPAGTDISIDMAGYDFTADGVDNALVVKGNATLINSSSESSSIIVNSAPAAPGSSSDTVQGIEVKSTGTLTIADGNIDVKGDGLGIGVLNYGTLNMNDGTITVEGDGWNMYGIFNYGGVVNMNGGEIVVNANGADTFGIVCFYDCTVNLNAGKIVVKKDANYAIGVLTGTATVTEGTEFAYDIQLGAKYYVDPVANLVVNGVVQ